MTIARVDGSWANGIRLQPIMLLKKVLLKDLIVGWVLCGTDIHN